MSFTTENTVRLIEMYRRNEILWKITHKNYRRTDLKNSVLQQIADELNINFENVKKKIRNLRNTYVQQKKLKQNKIKSGSGVVDDNKNWFLYNELKFLDEVVVLRRTSSNYESEIRTETENSTSYSTDVAQQAIDFDDYEEPSMSTMNSNSNHKTAKKTNKYDAALTEILGSGNYKTPTIFETFSSTVALHLEEINKLDVAESFSCMQEIQNLIGNKIAKLLKNKSATRTQTTCCPHSKFEVNLANSDDNNVSTNFENSTNSNFSDNILPREILNSSSCKTSTFTSNSPNLNFEISASTPKKKKFNNNDQDFKILSSLSSNSSIFNYKSTVTKPTDIKSTSTRPILYTLPEVKRIEILDDVVVNFKYDKSCLLSDAIFAAGITDEDQDVNNEHVLNDDLIEFF